MAKRPTDIDGAAVDGLDPIDTFQAAMQAIPGPVRVYRLNPMTPSDTNGAYVGAISNPGYLDLDKLREQFGGGTFKLQLLDPAKSNAIAKSLQPVRIDGPAKAPNAFTLAPVTTGQAGTVQAAPGDPVAAIQAQLAQLQDAITKIGGGTAPSNRDSQLVTVRDVMDMMRAQTPQAQSQFSWQAALTALPAIISAMEAMRPKGSVESALMLAQKLGVISTKSESTEPEVNPWAEVAKQLVSSDGFTRIVEGVVAKLNAPDAAQQPGQPGVAAPQVTAPRAETNPAAGNASDAPKADAPPNPPTIVPGAKLSELQRSALAIAAKQMADELEKNPALAPDAVAIDIAGQAAPEMLAEVLALMGPGELAAFVGQHDARLRPHGLWLVMVEGGLRALDGTEPDDEDDDDKKGGGKE